MGAFMASEDGRTFVPVAGARFSHGTLENHEHVNAWQAGPNLDNAIGIETGGDAIPEVDRGTYFSYPSRAPYNELISFQGKIPCLNDASNKNQIEACLSQANPNPTMSPVDTPSPTKSPIATPDPVSCGGHFAPTCAECPQGNGAAWCNGECIWRNNECVHQDDDVPTGSPTKSPVDTPSPTKSPIATPDPISCGGHFAPTCAECPQGNG